MWTWPKQGSNKNGEKISDEDTEHLGKDKMNNTRECLGKEITTSKLRERKPDNVHIKITGAWNCQYNCKDFYEFIGWGMQGFGL